jgi:hypothetical protein
MIYPVHSHIIKQDAGMVVFSNEVVEQLTTLSHTTAEEHHRR